ncbi:hypothetical protein I4U23_010132 [Adineta vaga]|nr:hypothetical protein I4U23_010132 [Adineta vaga]
MSTLLPVALIYFYSTTSIVRSISIGKLSHQIFIPTPPLLSVSISYNYTSTCNECLCYAIQSTTPFVALNCLTNTRTCILYRNYSTDYLFLWNTTSYAYFFQLPTRILTTVASQITTYQTSVPMITTYQTSTQKITTVSSTSSTSTTPDPCTVPPTNYIAMFTASSINYTFYSYLIVAQTTGYADLSFAFQGDLSASWHLDDVSFRAKNGTNTSELLVGGDFENFPGGWYYTCSLSCPNYSFGQGSYSFCRSGVTCFKDGCQGLYDFLKQGVWLKTNVAYNLSFWMYLDIGGGPAPRSYVSLQ